MHPAVYDGITMPGPQKALFRLWLNTTSLSFNFKYFLAAIPSYAFTDGLPTVFISTMTPLAGAGLIERAYPLILGSNLGTITTSILASFAAGGDNLKAALQISLVHLFFNLTGIILFYPIPWMRWPISIARPDVSLTEHFSQPPDPPLLKLLQTPAHSSAGVATSRDHIKPGQDKHSPNMVDTLLGHMESKV